MTYFEIMSDSSPKSKNKQTNINKNQRTPLDSKLYPANLLPFFEKGHCKLLNICLPSAYGDSSSKFNNHIFFYLSCDREIRSDQNGK